MVTTAILGGGISGLSAAFYLAKAGANSVKLFESSSRLGGWIKTEHHSREGFRFEKGPRTIRPGGIRGHNTLRMLEELNLEGNVMPINRDHIAAKNRMIFANNQLCLLPNSPWSLFKKCPPFTQPLIMAVVNDLLTGRSTKALQDESIYNFAERRFGTETAKYLVSSMICGICAGDAKEISVKFLINDLFHMEQKHGGVLRGVFRNWISKIGSSNSNATDDYTPSELVKRAQKEKWSIYSFRDGLETLPQTLGDHVQAAGVEIKNGLQCNEISLQSDHVTLDLEGNSHRFDQLISSLPSHQLARLVKRQHPELAAELAAISYVDVGLVNLQYDGELIEEPGFGFLVPPSENRPILGVIFDSCCFPSNGKTVLTVMMGGAWFLKRFGTDPSNKVLFDVATKQVSDILKINEKPVTGRVHILTKCIPQYVVGHSARVERIRKYIANNKLPLALCGAAYDGVGVNDVVYSAKMAVEKLKPTLVAAADS